MVVVETASVTGCSWRHHHSFTVTCNCWLQSDLMLTVSMPPLLVLVLAAILPPASPQRNLLFPFLRPFSFSSTRGRDSRPDNPVIIRASRVHKVTA